MTINRLYLFILIFAPLAFGAVEQWSFAIMGSLCLLALLWYSIFLLLKTEMLYEVPGILPLLLLLLYILFQIVPFPAGFVKFISPSTHDLYKETIGVFDPLAWMSISINKWETLNEFFRFSAYVAIYILTVQLLKDKVMLKKTISIIIIFASALSVFAILQYFLQRGETWSSHKLYFFRYLTYGGNPFGPYVCHNHYAGLMEMIFPLSLALFLSYRPSISYQSFREKIMEIFNHDRTNIYILLGFSSVLIAASIFLSLSRGGIVSLLCALLLFASMAYKRVMGRRSGMQIFLFFILTLMFIGWFGWGQVFDRFMQIRGSSGEIEDGRFLIWNDSIHIIKDFFLTGTGLGTFEDIYPTYRTFPGDRIVDHAHNDYLEIFSDGGIITIMLMAWFLGAVIRRSYKTFRKRRETYSIYLYIGSLTGIVSILLHSVTDFNLQIGANGLYFFFLCGTAVCAASTRIQAMSRHTYLNNLRFAHTVVTITLTFMLLMPFLIFNVGILVGKTSFLKIEGIQLTPAVPIVELQQIRDVARKASNADPLEARYRYALANAEWYLFNDIAAGFNHYKGAVLLNPSNSEYLQSLGWVMHNKKRYDRAELLFKAGIRYDRHNPQPYKNYAIWLFSQGRSDEAIDNLRDAISLKPELTDKCIALMLINGLSEQEIFKGLPEQVVPYMCYAEYLYQTDKFLMAEYAYEKAIEYVRNEEEVRPWYFLKVWGYYMKRGRFDDALRVMQEAEEYLPKDAGIHAARARLYEEMGIIYRAIQECRTALIIDPKNIMAKRRLERLTK